MDKHKDFLDAMIYVEENREFQLRDEPKDRARADELLANIEERFGLKKADLEESRDFFTKYFGAEEDTLARRWYWF